LAITTQITVVGNLVRDPELRYSKNGKPVVNVTIASTPRSYNRQTSQWEDGESVFMKGSCWDEMAENVAASLTKGARVVAVGTLKSSTYKDREGNEKQGWELQIDEIGHTMKYHTIRAEKRGKSSPVPKGPAQDQDGWASVNDDDIPF
jgi:single-strand DNA-binding protein